MVGLPTASAIAFRVDVVALVRLDVGLHILRWNQAHFMPWSRNARPGKCDPPQASMSIRSTFRFAVKGKSCDRENRHPEANP